MEEPSSTSQSFSSGDLPPRGSLTARVVGFFRRRIVTGLVFLVPFVLTVWVVVVLFQFADGILGKWLNGLLKEYAGLKHPIPTLGLFALLLVLLVVGFVASSRVGMKLVSPLERLLLSIPIVKSLYGGTKQILHAFTLSGRGGAFQKVALVEYPRKGLFALGFVTGRIMRPIDFRGEHYRELYTIFVPTTPNPTSGFLILSPVEETMLLGMTVEDGIKIILSGGFVQADLDLITSTSITTPPAAE